MSHWKKGKQLNNGQYTIDGILLRSGSGLSYKARVNDTGELAVIRIIENTWQNQQEYPQKQEQLIKQAIKIANCHHPNLVKLDAQVFQGDEQWYMVMEYVEGEDLASYVDCRGKFTEKQAVNIIGKIGSALNLLHQSGFIHQNVKPQNIVLRRDIFEPVLIDFGLAIELFNPHKQNVNLHAINPFIAIEQYQKSSPRGAYTDVYALAATLYVLVTAKLPAPANFRQYQDLIPPKQFNPTISEHLNQAILRGMELDVRLRPVSIREWLKLLKSPQETSINILKTNSDNPQSHSLPKIQASSATQKQPEEKLLPPVQSFDFDTVIFKTKPGLFGLVSGLRKNVIHRTGKCFTERLDNNVNLEMVFIPKGSFLMGSNNQEPIRYKNEGPQHKVTLAPFYMGKYPITQAQWKAVASLGKIKRTLNSNPSCFRGDNLPVEKISWYDAVEFCQRLSLHTGREYRLPTEAEWEYACRGGTKTAFYVGNTLATDLANYDSRKEQNKKAKSKYGKKTTPVDNFPPNPFGLYDLHGNVWEWCEDHYSSNYQFHPKDGTAYYSQIKSQTRVVRGGSWSLNSSHCRCARRSDYTPKSSYNFVGFRVVCVIKENY